MISKEALFGKLEPLALPTIVVLVGVGGFGLGRLSASPSEPLLRVIYPEAQAATPVASMAAVGEAARPLVAVPLGQGAYVASKNGAKYYLTTCSGANRIKQENKVYFVSAKDAIAAGYEAAANCPGL